MDYDLLGNLSNETGDWEVTPSESYIYLGKEIVYLLFSIAGVTVDAFLIYAIHSYHKLHVYSFMFVLNWAVADILHLVFNVSGYRLIGIIFDLTTYKGGWCIILKTGEIAYCIEVALLGVMATDWCLDTYSPSTGTKFKKHHKLVIACVWFSFLMFGVNNVFHCFIGTRFVLVERYGYFLYIVILLFVIIIQAIRGVRKCRGKIDDSDSLGLFVTTVLVVTLLIFGIALELYFAFGYYGGYFFAIASSIIHLDSWVVAFCLYKRSSDFRRCVLWTLKCLPINNVHATMEFDNPIHNIDDSTVRINNL